MCQQFSAKVGSTFLQRSPRSARFLVAPCGRPRPHSACWKGILSAIAALTLLGGGASTPAAAAPPTAQERRVDEAIVKALEYLSQAQEASGAWATKAYGDSTASTSLAVMAFLASGHVPNEGPYGRQIVRGVRWVLDHQQPGGMLVHRRSHGPMYSHGISTLMLAEVAGMLEGQLEKDCQSALEDAVRLILKAQQVRKNRRHAGGWRYQANSPDSDLSVTGWQLLALRAAKDIGCDVPADAIDKAVAYVKRCAVRGHNGFGYQSGTGPTPTRTGTGVLCLEVCGQHRTPEVLGAANYLLRRPLKYRDSYFFYGAYYCSVGMFKVGDRYWENTKKNLMRILLENQDNDGSWLVRGSETRIGRVYCTSMAVLALAVEYQYLPIYQR